jgi:transposase
MRLVQEAREQDPDVAERDSGADRSGTGINADTLGGWCKQAEMDAGRQTATTTSDGARIKELERENRQLKRANKILLAASSFFARELDSCLPLVVAFVDDHRERFGVAGSLACSTSTGRDRPEQL